MAETIWTGSLEVSVQKGDKKMPMGKYGYGKRKKKSSNPKKKKRMKSKKYPCMGCD